VAGRRPWCKSREGRLASIAAALLGCGSERTDGDVLAPPDPMSGAAWPMPTEPGLGLPHPRHYAILSGDVARDDVTGLHWQRSVSAQPFQTWQGALDACERLDLAGFRDWRLPSRIELTSILSLDYLDPAIDPVAFPDTAGDWFWTSTPDAADERDAWYVYFYLGYPDLEQKLNPFSVRCVRSGTQSPSLPRYAVDDATVLDLMTGLEWQRRATPELYTFAEARAQCDELRLAGDAPWRSPTMQELETLVDARRRSPAIDTTAFPDTPAASFWSGTPWVESPELRGWHVDFESGSAQYLVATTRFNVRCVR
jgi:Protein of unknown function (DUF1566)